MNCYGIDGCPAGWVALGAAAGEPLQDATLQCFVAPSIESLMEELTRKYSQPIVVAIDMPIGLPQRSGWRPCDLKARQALGARRASIFPVPSRSDLQATDFAQLKGSGLSIQAFNLFKKIRQLDEWMDPERQKFCRETHPELVFWRLNQGQTLESKRTAVGAQQRREIVSASLPQIGKLQRVSGCRPDDLLDAAALLLAAWRLQHSQENCAFDSCQLDDRGLSMEICY